LNDDGAIDLAMVSGYGGTALQVLLGRGNGTFVARLTDAVGSAVAPSIVAADFNGDGRPDLVTASDSVDSISVLLNEGGGVMAPHTDYVTDFTPAEVAVGDLNGDGKPDIAVAEYESSAASVFYNQGNGTFGPKVDYPISTDPQAPSNPAAIAIADLNGDAQNDLIVGNFGNAGFSSVSVFLNLGSGMLSPKTDYMILGSPTSIATGDFDGDGKVDLLVSGGGVHLFLNKGGGAFGPPIVLDLRITAHVFGFGHVAAGDLNNDGKLDFAVGLLSDGVGVFLNVGGTTFTNAATLYPAGTDIALGDVNGDKQLDIVVAATGANVFLNLGGGSFAPALRYDALGASVALADFDGDGKLDIATSDVSVLLNRCW
jgi:hypothetical protein